MDALIEYAKKFVGLPYIWGGSNPMNGFDCSGFVQWILESVGADPAGDQNAQALHNLLLANGGHLVEFPRAGAVVFYGRTSSAISHVSFCLNKNQIIEAGGGDHTTINAFEAMKKNACVRIRPFDRRKDVVAIVFPKYPAWFVNG